MKSLLRKKWFLITCTGLVIVLALGLVLVFGVFGGNPPFLVSAYTRHTNTVESVVWSPDGKYIASANVEGSAQVWDAMTGHKILTYSKQANLVGHSLAWSPDGKYIASEGGDGIVQVWDAMTGYTRLTMTDVTSVDPNFPVGICWSPDGKKIATLNENTVLIRDATTGARILTYTGHTSEVDSLAWSPDGKYITSGSDDHTAQVWDVVKGTRRVTYTGHGANILSIAWSPDGKRIVTGDLGGIIQVWDAGTGKHYVTYTPHKFLENFWNRYVLSVAWSPDGKYIASASGNSVQIWKTP